MVQRNLNVPSSNYTYERLTQTPPGQTAIELNFNSNFCRQGIIGVGFFQE
jgi:hypothetical protein